MELVYNEEWVFDDFYRQPEQHPAKNNSNGQGKRLSNHSKEYYHSDYRFRLYFPDVTKETKSIANGKYVDFNGMKYKLTFMKGLRLAQ